MVTILLIFFDANCVITLNLTGITITMKKIHYAILLVFSMIMMPALTQAALSHEALMSLTPSPNVKDAAYGGVGIFVYDDMNSLDALGPMQVFSAAGLRPFLIAKKAGTVRASNGLTINVTKGIADFYWGDFVYV